MCRISNPIRLAIVAEGYTDFIYLEAVLQEILKKHEIVFTLLQPEESAAFASAGIGLGWPGVYRWCHQSSHQPGNRFRNNLLFQFHDILIVHLDADVAGRNYSSGHIDDSSQDLPCEKPCPPPADTTEALRKVMLRWLGEKNCPSRTVLCTPSKSLETWILAGLYPKDRIVRSRTLECRKHPESLLASKPVKERLVRKKGGRYDKDVERYRKRTKEFQESWSQVEATCTEANRFSDEIRNEVAALPSCSLKKPVI